MKFGQFEIIRWHQTKTPEQSIEAVMEKIELGDQLGRSSKTHSVLSAPQQHFRRDAHLSLDAAQLFAQQGLEAVLVAAGGYVASDVFNHVVHAGYARLEPVDSVRALFVYELLQPARLVLHSKTDVLLKGGGKGQSS